MSLPRILLLALLVGAGPAGAQDFTVKFRGYAYDLASSRFLYTEIHEQTISGDRWLGGSIDYYAPDGSEIGRKTLDFSQDRYVPLYRLELKTGGGYMEGITALTPARIDMVKKGYGTSEVRRVSVKRHNPVAADSGFHVFIRDRFADLMSGKTVSFVFVVSGSLDAFKFRARRLPDTAFEDKPAVRFRVEPDSLLRWLVDPLELTYNTDQRKLLEYRGVSNLHDPATGEAYNVRIIYPSSPPADAPALPAGL